MNTLRLGLGRGIYDTKLFLRRREAVAFTLAFPVIMLVMFGAIFGNNYAGDTGIRFNQVLVAGILASGVASVSFVSLAIGIATERDEGGLKRLAGSPMPPAAYFLGKIVLVMLTGLAEATVLIVVGVVLYGVNLPSDVGRWWTFAWVFVLGLGACTVLGIAMSSVPRSAKSAAAVVNLPFVALQFISGVFVPFNELPSGLRTFASIFPLKWMSQGFRSVFLPAKYLRIEPSQRRLSGLGTDAKTCAYRFGHRRKRFGFE